jgi:hypothetical protein
VDDLVDEIRQRIHLGDNDPISHPRSDSRAYRRCYDETEYDQHSDEDDRYDDYYLDSAQVDESERRPDRSTSDFRRPVHKSYPGPVNHYNPQQPIQRQSYGQYNSPFPRSPRHDSYKPDIACGACGGRGHHAHECRKRCPACGLVHRPGECEKMQQMQALMKFVAHKFKDDDLPEEIRNIQPRLN